MAVVAHGQEAVHYLFLLIDCCGAILALGFVAGGVVVAARVRRKRASAAAAFAMGGLLSVVGLFLAWAAIMSVGDDGSVRYFGALSFVLLITAGVDWVVGFRGAREVESRTTTDG